MTQNRWSSWVLIAVAIAAVGEGVGYFAGAAGVDGLGWGLTLLGRVLLQAWVVFGLISLAGARVWYWTGLVLATQWLGVGLCLLWAWLLPAPGGLVLLAAAGVVATGLTFFAFTPQPAHRQLVTFCIGAMSAFILALTAAYLNQRGAAMAIAGSTVMVVGFVLGIAGIRALLTGGHPIIAVARTLVDEAIRMKVALIFIIGLVVILPTLPFFLDSSERLSYRLQFFLAWSLGGASMLLSLMTIFLAVGTISSEIRFKQIHMTLVKPISRAQYLLGKWLGIALLNLVLVSVSGVAIYTFARIMQDMPGVDPYDKAEVREQVLVARAGVLPVHPDPDFFESLIQEEVRRRQELNEELRDGVPPELLDDIYKTQRLLWHSVPPGGARSFVFEGLGEARQFGQEIQLRLKPQVAASPLFSEARFYMQVNDRPFPTGPSGEWYETRLADRVFHEVPISVDRIGDDGKITLTIINATPGQTNEERNSLAFVAGEGLEMLYHVDRFEGNLARAMAMVWVRLSFLSMIGIAAASLMGFSVAALFSMMVYFVGAADGFFTDAVSSYASVRLDQYPLAERLFMLSQSVWVSLTDPTSETEPAPMILVRMVGEVIMALIPRMSSYDPTALVAGGRLVSYGSLSSAFIWLGVIWSLVFGVIGWYVFQRRELARVIV